MICQQVEVGRGAPKDVGQAGKNLVLNDVRQRLCAKQRLGRTKNAYKTGQPDLMPKAHFPNDAAQTAEDGVEVKVTNKPGGGVDMHGARPAWYAIFRYETDFVTQPVVNRKPTRFTN